MSAPLFRIGARGSKLSLAQTGQTRAHLAARLGLDEDAFEIVPIVTSGDRIQDRTLIEAGGKGLFTKELDEALFDGRIDLAIHSLKDLPTRLPDGIVLACVPEREDPRDAWVSPHCAGLADLPPRVSQTTTLEHLGYSTEAQNRRIARMGLMVSAQPNYIRVLGEAYGREGLGPGRAEAINRLGSLERKGVPLGLHSDFNMAPVDPLYLAWIAANRIGLSGKVLAPQERLSLDKALRAVTIEAAQVIGLDATIGSIAPGKKADFAVLDADPYAVGAARLREIRIAGVVFEGRYTPA